MPEYHSALYNALTAGKYGASPTDDSLTLQETPVGTLLQLAGWNGFESAASAFLDQLGARLPDDYQVVSISPNLRIYRTAPNRLMISSGRPLLLPSFDAAELSTLDLSHSKTALLLTGKNAQNVLARCAPMDFGRHLFPVNSYVQTGIHEVGVLIDRTEDDAFKILIPYTWAKSVLDKLYHTAMPFGLDIQT